MSCNIIITGGAGFIGFNLVETLLQDKNNNVTVWDNFVSSSKENIENLMKLRKNPRFHLLLHDVEDSNKDLLDLTAGSVDQIYHLACPASPKFYQKDPVKTLNTCYIGTRNMLELAKTTGATLLFTSTSEVYGDPLEHPQSEEYRGNVNPIGTRACYDSGKRVAETLCFDYHRKFGVKIRVARIFNTYGPKMRMDDGRVVSNFIVQALKGSDLTIYGDGSQTRSFCYVSDTVRGLIALMNSTVIGPVNIGNPDEYTVLQLADKIKELVEWKYGRKIAYIYKDLPKDDPTRRKPAIEKAKKELDWEPTITLNLGLGHTIAYFENLMKSKI